MESINQSTAIQNSDLAPPGFVATLSLSSAHLADRQQRRRAQADNVSAAFWFHERSEANDEAGVGEILERIMQGLQSSSRAFAWTVYEMANRQRPGAVYNCWARLCVSDCRREFSQGCVGRDQVERGKPCKAGGDLSASACVPLRSPAVQALALAGG